MKTKIRIIKKYMGFIIAGISAILFIIGLSVNSPFWRIFIGSMIYVNILGFLAFDIIYAKLEKKNIKR